MENIISAKRIRGLGFDWPKTATVQEYTIVENGGVNIDKSLANLRKSRAFYKNQITAAYNFKTRTGADYSDFTDKFDDYVRMERLLNEDIKYLEQILAAQFNETSP